MNMPGFTYVEKLIGAILETLLALGVIALKDQDPSCRRSRSHGTEFQPAEDNSGQMLLPGIAEPRWWEINPDASHGSREISA